MVATTRSNPLALPGNVFTIRYKPAPGISKNDGRNFHAFATVDHQFSHVFVKNADTKLAARVADLFAYEPGIDEVLTGDQLAEYDLNHARSGEVVLVSTADSWQAYYWWLDDTKAPKSARTVDIHRRPGYDPVELHFDPATKSIPLDASLVKGSHGAPVRDSDQRTVILSSDPGILTHHTGVRDTDVFHALIQEFDIAPF